MVELESIAPFPSCTSRTTNSRVELVALSKAMALAAHRCLLLHLPMLLDQFGDPFSVRIPSDGPMEWINEDNLKEFVRGIFTNPVRIQDSQSPTVAPSSLLEEEKRLASHISHSSKLETNISLQFTTIQRPSRCDHQV